MAHVCCKPMYMVPTHAYICWGVFWSSLFPNSGEACVPILPLAPLFKTTKTPCSSFRKYLPYLYSILTMADGILVETSPSQFLKRDETSCCEHLSPYRKTSKTGDVSQWQSIGAMHIPRSWVWAPTACAPHPPPTNAEVLVHLSQPSSSVELDRRQAKDSVFSDHSLTQSQVVWPAPRPTDPTGRKPDCGLGQHPGFSQLP